MKDKTIAEVFNKANKKQKQGTRELSFITGLLECNVRKQMNNPNPSYNTMMKFVRCFGMTLIMEDKEGKQYKIK